MPGQAHAPGLIDAGVIVAAAWDFLGMPIFNRGVLETEPEDADLFAVSSGVAE